MLRSSRGSNPSKRDVQTDDELGNRLHRESPDADPLSLIDTWEYHTSDETDG